MGNLNVATMQFQLEVDGEAPMEFGVAVKLFKQSVVKNKWLKLGE